MRKEVLNVALWCAIGVFGLVLLFILGVIYQAYPDMNIDGTNKTKIVNPVIINPLPPIVPAIKNITLTCVDSDNGKIYSSRGRAFNASASAFDDVCVNSQTLTEYYCDAKGKVAKENHNCEGTCSSGKCLDITANCVKSDKLPNGEGNTTVLGNITGIWKVFNRMYSGQDYCIASATNNTKVSSSSILNEFYCLNNFVDAKLYSCTGGCLNGICLGNAVEVGCDACLATNKNYSCTENGNTFCSNVSIPGKCELCTKICGNGVCDRNENNKICPVDCKILTCWDGLCQNPDERTDSCPYDCNPACGNGVCDDGETPANCVIGDSTDCNCGGTTCGNLVCEPPAENNQNCASEAYPDCVGLPNCGDTICNAGSNETIYNCPSDCKTGSFCGNGFCEFGEVFGCADCAVQTCGDGDCNCGGESVNNCASDCILRCGDGKCEINRGETRVNCASDCNGFCQVNSDCPANYVCRNNVCTRVSTQLTNITVGSPNGGENMAKGEVSNIQWGAPNRVININISLIPQTGSAIKIADEIVNAMGSYNWLVSSAITDGQYKVRVMDYSNASFYDDSDAFFTISSPTGACTDSDGGKNYDILGNTANSSDNRNDNCFNANTLVEYFCENGAVKSEQKSCTCQTGICTDTTRNALPRIDSLSLASGNPGTTQITITGEGFDSTNNVIVFKLLSSPFTYYNGKSGLDFKVNGLASASNGRSIQFNIPSNLYDLISGSDSIPTVKGRYEISVINDSTKLDNSAYRSNSKPFEILGDGRPTNIIFTSPTSASEWNVGQSQTISWIGIDGMTSINLIAFSKTYKLSDTQKVTYSSTIARGKSNLNSIIWTVKLNETVVGTYGGTTLPWLSDGKLNASIHIEGIANGYNYEDSSDYFIIINTTFTGSCNECPSNGYTECVGTTGTRTCSLDVNNCLKWSSTNICSSGQSCSAGVCGSTGTCTVGQRKCFDSQSYQECNSLLEWSLPAQCQPNGAICSGAGVCSGGITISYPVGGEIFTQGQTIRAIWNYAGGYSGSSFNITMTSENGVDVYSVIVQGLTTVANIGINDKYANGNYKMKIREIHGALGESGWFTVTGAGPACTDECASNICVGNKIKLCGNYDADSCLEYSASAEYCAPAGKTSSGGQCINGVCTTSGCFNPSNQYSGNCNCCRPGQYACVGFSTSGGALTFKCSLYPTGAPLKSAVCKTC